MAKDTYEDLVKKSALALAEIGWRKADTRALAEVTGYPERDLIGAFGTKFGLVGAVNRILTSRSIAGHVPAKDETIRERLFDILMERFEAARDLRPFFREIKHAASRDPAVMPAVMLSLQCNMWAVLKAAGVRFRTPLSLLKVKGLTLLYLPVSNTFLADETEDLSKTMAALDKALERAEHVMQSLKSGPFAAAKKAARKAKSSGGGQEKADKKSGPGLERRPAAKTGAASKEKPSAGKKKKPPARAKAAKKKAPAKSRKKKPAGGKSGKSGGKKRSG